MEVEGMNGYRLIMTESRHEASFKASFLLSLLYWMIIFIPTSLAPGKAYGVEFNSSDNDNINVSETKKVKTKNPDPLESINRVSFWITDKIDHYALRPVAVAYDFVMPELASQGVTNVFLNLTEIQVLVNNLLQLKFKNAAVDAGRFTLNSTFGLLGLVDVATPLGLEKNFEDFGQTLGYWGVPSGPYLFIPFLGPSSFRDGSGLAVDYFLKPRTYVDHVRTKNSILVTGVIDKRARGLKLEKAVFGDKYIFLRDFYLNRRSYLVNDGVEDDGDGADFFDDELNDSIFNELD